MDGTFSLSTVPKRVVFYIEGPPPGVEILVKSVVIVFSSPTENEVCIIFSTIPLW